MKKQNILKIVSLLLLFTIPLFAGSESLSGGSLLSILSGAFVAGILLTFTPCVLPMIPILSSVIAGQGEKISKTKAIQLSFAYVLGTAITYAAMGGLAGATGEQLQSYFQNVWAIGIMSMIFVLMALSMFGLFTVQLPASLQTRLDSTAHHLKGGSFFTVFLLGLVSALVLGACVSPVLISFLSVAIAQSDPLLGAETMFALALGMGVPLLLIGLGAGYLLPKAGAWMDGIKHFFGVILLGVAIAMFAELQLFSSLFLWGIYFIGIAVYMGAVNFYSEALHTWQRFQKTVATLLLIWGIITLVGAAQGHTNLYLPLKNMQTPMIISSQNGGVEKIDLPFEDVANLKAYEAKKEQARREHKPIVIFFHSQTCMICEKLKNTTLQSSEIREILKESYVALMVDLTDRSNEEANAIKERFKVFGPPALVIFDADGTLFNDEILYGYHSEEELFDTLDLNAE